MFTEVVRIVHMYNGACLQIENGRVFRPGRSTNSITSILRVWTLTSPVAPAANPSARLLLRRARCRLLLDRTLQIQGARRQILGAGLLQKGVEAAIVVDALDRVGGDAQPHVSAQRIRDEGDVAEVRQEPPLGLDVGVAHLVARLGALGRQFTAPRHRSSPLPSLEP
jgi:hypothetical protein